jgi:hypothetical protein
MDNVQKHNSCKISQLNSRVALVGGSHGINSFSFKFSLLSVAAAAAPEIKILF